MEKTETRSIKRDTLGGDSSLIAAVAAVAPINFEEAVDLARTFGALADPVRIQLLSIVASKGEVCSCDLIRPLAKSQPTISHHTTILSNAGLLIGEKRGRWTWWRVAPDALGQVRAALGASSS